MKAYCDFDVELALYITYLRNMWGRTVSFKQEKDPLRTVTRRNQVGPRVV
jgi:hypothetical protein